MYGQFSNLLKSWQLHFELTFVMQMYKIAIKPKWKSLGTSQGFQNVEIVSKTQKLTNLEKAWLYDRHVHCFQMMLLPKKTPGTLRELE